MKEDNELKDTSTEYVTKLFHEDAMMTGFLHVKFQRVRSVMKAWKSTSEKRSKINPEEKNKI